MNQANFKIFLILLLIISFGLVQKQCKKPSVPPSSSDTTGQRTNVWGSIERVCDQTGQDTRDYKDVVVTLSGNITKISGLDNMGYYQFDSVPSGTYLIRASKPGYPDAIHYICVLASRNSSTLYELYGSGMKCSWSSSNTVSPGGLLTVQDMFLVLQPVNVITSLKAIVYNDSIEAFATTDSMKFNFPYIPVLFFIGNDPNVSSSHFMAYQDMECYHGQTNYNFDVTSLINNYGFKHGQTAYITACVGGMFTTFYFNPLGFEVYSPVSANFSTLQVVIP